MRNCVWMKGLVVAIISIFVEASIAPMIIADSPDTKLSSLYGNAPLDNITNSVIKQNNVSQIEHTNTDGTPYDEIYEKTMNPTSFTPASGRGISLSDPNPTNNSLILPFNLTCFSITLNHSRHESMDINWQTNTSGSWMTFNTTFGVSNGTYLVYNSNWLSFERPKKYWWRVLVNDSRGTWKNATFTFTIRFTYTEQEPPPSSEWDSVYENYTLVTLPADLHFNRNSQKCSSNWTKYVKKFDLRDRDFSSFYETASPFNITTAPLRIWFDWPNATNISFMRFYYYSLQGLDYAPAVYQVYNSSTLSGTYNLTPQENGQWVRVDFPSKIIKTTNITLKVLQTRGSIDHPNTNTKVVFNEIEFFDNNSLKKDMQHLIPMFFGISKFWNGLDWSISLRVDDCWDLFQVQSMWTKIQPISAMCYNPSMTLNTSLIISDHMEIGSHGNVIDHKAYYEKNYSWWYPKVTLAKSKVEQYTNKTSLWGDTCISWATPFSVMDPPGCKAVMDAGFLFGGRLTGPTWNWNRFGGQNLTVYNVSEPHDTIPVEWFETGGAGYITMNWDPICSNGYKNNQSYALFIAHPYDVMSNGYKSFIENDTTGWHCTIGELASYWWYKKRTNITYNESSTAREKIFDITILKEDPDVWEIPVTFRFNLTGYHWKENITITWRNNGTLYTNNLCNISNLMPGYGQHQNQTMREGFRWDAKHFVLYISIKPGNVSKQKSIHLFLNNSDPVAEDDYVTVVEDSIDNQINVLANDYDSNDDNLTITSITQPLHGFSLTDGSYVYYTPDQNYNGIDTFVYTISDGYGGNDTAIVYLTVTEVNDPPNKPERPSGFIQGWINVENTYTTKTIDRDGDQVFYNWSWGDGNYSGWLGPFNSNTTASGSHTWTIKGLYTIKVKAKDADGLESVWSDPLAIRMPVNLISGDTSLLNQFHQSSNVFLLQK